MQKITPFLWFDDNAEEAINLYASVFKNSKIGAMSRYNEASAKAAGKEPGSVMTAEFELAGLKFAAINGGPVFKFTPSISFFVRCETTEEIDKLWEDLSKDGTVRMPLDKYEFSERFGWARDRFGVEWQLIISNEPQRIVPFLWYHEHAEEAMNFYASVFKDSKINDVYRFAEGGGVPAGKIMHATFRLNGQEFIAMDANKEPFNEAISFVVACDGQKEVDYYWDKLSEGGDEKAQQCAWLKDKYGVSWQIVPTILYKLLGDPNPVKSKKVTEAMLKMKKIEIDGLMKAYEEA